MSKEYQFEFTASIGGYGVVYANNEEEAKEKVLDGDYEDVIDTWDMEIEEVTKIEEVEE